MVELMATKRAKKSVIGADSIPAVMYGAGQETISLTINKNEFTRVHKEAGEATTITLNVDGDKKNALIHDITREPVRYGISHVDFYLVSQDQKIHVGVPVIFTGEAPAVKEGHLLLKVMHEIPVYGKASDIPHQIEVSVAGLTGLDSAIHAGDIALPAGTSLYHIDAKEVVAAISAASEEVETPTVVDISKIEVVKKGKKEEVEK